MIRFSCPGCEAVFNVSDDKAGKTGKCPKCSSQFTIPAAPGGAASAPVPAQAPPPPPPAPPPGAGGAAVEIAPCPKCGARLSVEAGDVGLDVECPTCRAVYPAEAAVAVKPRNSGSGQKKPLVVAEPEAEEEDERPSRRREVARTDDERSSRRSRRDDDDEEEDRPRKKKRSGRVANMDSKRMPAALLALFLGGFGAHKFYLGYTTPGLVMLVITLLGYIGGCTGFFCLFTLPLFLVPLLTGGVGFIEFIIYLSRDDDKFIETYQINRQEWF